MKPFFFRGQSVRTCSLPVSFSQTGKGLVPLIHLNFCSIVQSANVVLHKLLCGTHLLHFSLLLLDEVPQLFDLRMLLFDERVQRGALVIVRFGRRHVRYVLPNHCADTDRPRPRRFGYCSVTNLSQASLKKKLLLQRAPARSRPQTPTHSPGLIPTTPCCALRTRHMW